MHLVFRKADARRITNAAMFHRAEDDDGRDLWKTVVYIGSMVGILVFLNWTHSEGTTGVWDVIYRWKYLIIGFFALSLLYALVRWFRRSELKDWIGATRDFAVQILPLLFAGVLAAGFLLGRPGHMALIPESWIAAAVGSNSLLSNFIASISGALMYFATLTEIPIMQGLIGAGMSEGPSLALLLAGPSLSLPSLLVIGGELGLKKTFVYAIIVVSMSTMAGVLYGTIVQNLL
jgi:hypothetical protein